MPIQAQYQVPHCSAEREQAFAQNILNHLVNNAGDTVLSYPLREQDHELKPSPLIQLLAEQGLIIDQTEAETVETTSEIFTESVTIDNYSDQHLPQLPLNQTARGGAAILSQQAQCPFKAGASFRLQATDIPIEPEGASPLDRGNQLHEIMEKLWQQIGNSQQLAAMHEERLHKLIQRIIDEVMKKYCYRRPDLYHDNFLALEKQRYHKLVNNWLDVEKQRPTDFTAMHMEQDNSIAIGGLVLKTRADRIDQLASGEYIILDYKTGQTANSKSWLEETITEPQLPLYSLAESYEVAGLALAKINEKRCQFNGVTKSLMCTPSDSGVCLESDSSVWSRVIKARTRTTVSPSIKRSWG